MTEVLYDINSLLIAAILLASMLLAIEVGYRLGVPSQDTVSDAYKSHVNSISGSLLGILALLLGFTFSLSLQRYDSRSEAVVSEANAIGTTFLRAQLLPEALRNEVKQMLRDYVDLRVKAGNIALTEHQALQAMADESQRLQNRLWNYAVQAVELDPSPVKTGLFIQTLNDLIDNFARRDAELARHVPEFVLLLLYVTFVMTGAVVGYASGLSSHPRIAGYPHSGNFNCDFGIHHPRLGSPAARANSCHPAKHAGFANISSCALISGVFSISAP